LTSSYHRYIIYFYQVLYLTRG